MTRITYPLSIADTASFARNLRTQFIERQSSGKALPGHVEMLNMLARAAGLRNYQTLKAPVTQSATIQSAAHAPRALATAKSSLASPSTTDTQPPSEAIRKALLQFDERGRLVRLPGKLSVQRVVMWSLWMRFSANRKYSEKEVNTLPNAWHTFGDQATLRRELINMKLLGRTQDGSVYWKEPARPEADIQVFLRSLRSKGAA